MSTIKQNNPIYKCETCMDTGFYGDNGPGVKDNREYQRCECKKDLKPDTNRKRA